MQTSGVVNEHAQDCGTAKWSIEPLQSAHLRHAVRLHMDAFPKFFLTFLGPSFLRELYRAYIADPDGVGVVATTDSGQLLGIAVGCTSSDGFFRRLLKRRWWAFSAACVPGVVRDPLTVPRLIRALSYRGDSFDDQYPSLLSSLAVSPQYQGAGIGRALVNGWLSEIQARGSRGCYLTTDAQNNDEVLAFYHKLGWRVHSSFETKEGRSMLRLRYRWSD